MEATSLAGFRFRDHNDTWQCPCVPRHMLRFCCIRRIMVTAFSARFALSLYFSP
jgi:hypothetical protein